MKYRIKEKTVNEKRVIHIHLNFLQDVKELKFTDNQAYEKEKAKKGDSYIDTQTSPYICPVVGLEMNGTYK